MPKVLKGGAYGPDGDYVEPGKPPSKDWPDWFVKDLEEHGHLVDATADERDGDGDASKVELTGTTSRGRKARS